MGRFDESVSHARRAQELDPLSLANNLTLGVAHYFAGDFEQSAEQLRKTLEIEPRFYPARLSLSFAYAELGQFDHAIAGAESARATEDLPLVLAPMLTLSVYIYARYGQGNASFAALAGLFTPVSFYTTVGLWGGYYANWLALIMVYLFMTCLLIFSRSPSAVNYCAMYILSVTLFLTHPYTWVMIVMVSLVFAISLWKETKSLVHVKSVIPIIATGIVIDIVKSFVFATQSVAAGWPYSVVGGAASLLAFWNNLVEALLYTHGGLLASWLVLGMGLLASSRSGSKTGSTGYFFSGSR